ncbi:MAG: hydantoinase/oxoprolinase family protein [Synergistaceae bacterium]|nr:hydantoinase/oxoprolinase family protein [Synergistaceae bacterium]
MDIIPEKSNDYGILGIDAGGTFTDLAFLQLADASVTASVKTPTDHDDLVGTISRGLELISEKIDINNIIAVNLATTFATNAIVEEKTHSSGLVLIGYDEEQVEKAVKEDKFGTDRIILIAGGHDTKGNEQAPFDRISLGRSIKKLDSTVRSVGVSGFFSVRNPSHEIAAKEEIISLCPGMSVTCGHELSSDLDAILRAATVSLNAGLIPIVMDLLVSVEKVLRLRGITVPLSVVRGDGSLVNSEWAKTHPIETIVSGPAASALGAAWLGKAQGIERGSWVVDIGGTTTDIIYLDKNGEPAVSAHGASVGSHRTLIKAIDIFTVGLGGDSRVKYDPRGDLFEIGPGRVRPLCSAVYEAPALSGALSSLKKSNNPKEPLLIVKNRTRSSDGVLESKLEDGLKEGLCSREALAEKGYVSRIYFSKLEEMKKAGLLDFAGFTPTDALHVMGKLDKWDREASVIGAKILAGDKNSPEEISAHIFKKFIVYVALSIFKKSMILNGFGDHLTEDAEKLLTYMLLTYKQKDPFIQLKVNSEIIGIGAPAWAFIKEAANLLGEEGNIPLNAEVAGAVGAAVSSFSMKYSVWITPVNGNIFRVHLPEGICDYDDLDTAVEKAEKFMKPWICRRAKKIGAENPAVESSRIDEKAETSGGTEVYLWTELIYKVKEDRGCLFKGDAICL